MLKTFEDQNEKSIWKHIHKHQPISVNEITRKTEISKPTVIKILKHLKELDEINYPKQKRGKTSWITLRNTQFNKFFKRVKKQANELRDNYDLTIIIQTKSLEIFAGDIDECELNTLMLYNAHHLDNSKWISVEGEDQMNWLNLELADIDKIFTLDLKEIQIDKIHVNDIMKIWKDQTHEIRRGIKCKWIGDEKKHLPECDADIHESLRNIFQHITYDSNIPKKEKIVLKKSFEKIVEFIIIKGGKIPG